MECYPETYIFKDVEDYFESKLECFYDKYVTYLVSGGMTLNFSKVIESDMVLNSKFSLNYYKMILKSISSANPLIKISSHTMGGIDCICKIFYLNNYREIESFYILKQRINFKTEGHTFSAISKIDCSDLNSINKHWL